MKMLKDDIAGLKAGKSIQKGSRSSGFVRAGLRPDPGKGGRRGRTEFQSHQVRCHVGQPVLRKRDGQPEKGTSPQVKGKAACHIAAQIDQGIPEKAPLAHCPMGKNKKGYLLDIVVPVIKKQTLSVN